MARRDFMRSISHRKVILGLCAAGIVALAVAAAMDVTRYLGTDQAGENRGAPELRYAREYPFIGYSTTPPAGRVGELLGRLEQGGAALEPGSDGRLTALLAELEIDASSQLLVFSKTSLQAGIISPATPRAIYFNDDTYVAAVPGAASLEIATMDPRLGPTFFTLDRPTANIERHTSRCLRCHDSYSLTGGGVPRFMLGSGYIDSNGELVSHEAWILTNQGTPLKNRWGGWYVSGEDAGEPHLGNLIVDDAAALRDLDSLRVASPETLEGLLDTSAYLTPYSDIVALLVAEHQIDVQNAITRVSYDVQALLHAADGAAGADGAGGADDAAGAGGADDAAGTDDAGGEAGLEERIAEIVEPLVEKMLFVGAAPLEGPIASTSGFADAFERRGVRDSEGRSLRDFDLEGRLFGHAVSYLIHSEGFAALPAAAHLAALRRIAAVLRGEADDAKFSHLSRHDRERTAQILRDTHAGIAALL